MPREDGLPIITRGSQRRVRVTSASAPDERLCERNVVAIARLKPSLVALPPGLVLAASLFDAFARFLQACMHRAQHDSTRLDFLAVVV